ncbi:MAG TPA: MOSC domain-containing protein [Candidatus Saccharimonadales bacterium]|jgi:MOSC domain-containing protein YiiM|nr:MOSC domain-containing protein [Candidatus Saccharimonadales bacterium]
MARVVSLQLHEAHGKPMRPVQQVDGRVGGGLEGDSHAHRAKRAVTIVDRSTHDAVGVKPGDLREQITVEGLPSLGSFAEGTLLRIGAITLRVNGSCDPCTHIGEMNGIADPDEFQAMLEGRRGLVCTVILAEGPVRVGDLVSAMEPAVPS